MAGLFDPVSLGALQLRNRIVMAPMTRSRADAHDCPTDLHVAYYSQRADAGLIVTEGVHPSPEGKGYARTPGLYDEGQVAAWRQVTEMVHALGGLIVAQLMHVGRIAAAANRPADTDTIAPSAVTARAKLWTPEGMAPTLLPDARQTVRSIYRRRGGQALRDQARPGLLGHRGNDRDNGPTSVFRKRAR